MNTFRLVLLSFALSFGCSYMVMPTDYTTVAAGTRANLAANFSEATNKFNPCADSVAQVRARLSNYTTSLTITSLENLRLRVDGDATATGIFLVEGSSGDSLFRVSENLNARLFGHVAIDSNLTVRKVSAADSVVGAHLKTVSGNLIVGGTAAITGAASTGALSATTGSFSSTLGVTGLMTASGGILLNGGSDGPGRITKHSAHGIIHQGVTGTLNDWVLFNQAGQYLINNPTGTQSLQFQGAGTNAFTGAVTMASTLGVTGNAAFDTDVLFVDAANNRVGIRDATPSQALDVNGDVAVVGSQTISSTLGVTGVATFTAAPVFSSVTASQFLLVDGSKALTSVAGTGSGSVVRQTGATLSAPSITGLTANRTLATDGSGNVIVSSETGTSSHVRQNSPTIGSPTITGTMAAADITASGTLAVSSYAAIGGSATSDTWLRIVGSTGLTTSTNYGVVSFPTFQSNATTAGNAGYFQVLTQATSFTMGTGRGIYIRNPSVGAGSTITTAVGLDIENQTAGGTNYAIRTGSGLVSFGGNVSTTGTVTTTGIITDGNEEFDYDEGTFTATATGMTTSPTGTVYYVRVGKQVTLHFPLITGTSNANTFTLTGLPASLQPASLVSLCPLALVTVGTGPVISTDAAAEFSNGSGTIVLYVDGSATGWAASGTKAIHTNTVTYTLQ